ncbi:MAG TPA: hypothetical protein VJT85_01085, partial [Gemmatimonadaceae bacterium]|nr:hypothetical protein [Gemmatimonadaceae bacterium]
MTDTALAVLANALVVRVTPPTGSSAGLQVRFEALPSEPTGQLAIEQTVVSAGPTTSFQSSATVATDASGQAQARIQLGSIPGETRVIVTCPQLSVTDTARFHIVAGPTARILLSIRDTIILAGSTFTVRAVAADQSGNATKEKVAFSAGTNVLSVTDSGRVSTASVAGRGVVRVSTPGTVRDSVRFTSYVGGRVTFITYANDAWGTLMITDIDGANPRVLRNGFTLSNSLAEPAPHDDAVVYNQISGPSEVTNAKAALLLDVDRVERTVADPLILPYSGHPRFGRDGEFVYFTGRSSLQGASAIWRVRRDGSGLEQLTSPTPASG